MKALTRLLLFVFVSCASAQPAAPPSTPPSARDAVKSVAVVEAVRIDKPARFWQAGKWIESRDAVVLRVEVRDPMEFLPRDISDPQFVYGRAVCRVLVSPLIDGTAVLLAPPLRPGDPDTLRVIPALHIERLDAQSFERILDRTRSIAVPKPDAASATPRTVPSINRLRDEWNARKRRSVR